jgi:hypothetical protein
MNDSTELIKAVLGPTGFPYPSFGVLRPIKEHHT